MGPLVNEADSDWCAVSTRYGKVFLFDSDRAGSFGSMDL
jgi:hypothetical protein